VGSLSELYDFRLPLRETYFVPCIWVRALDLYLQELNAVLSSARASKMDQARDGSKVMDQQAHRRVIAVRRNWKRHSLWRALLVFLSAIGRPVSFSGPKEIWREGDSLPDEQPEKIVDWGEGPVKIYPRRVAHS
jgi:hypothetical protein